MAETDQQKQRGRGPGRRFVKGQSGNPAGKPKGARSRVTLAAEALLEGQAEALTQAAIEKALTGDAAALRLCLDRIYPVRRGATVRFDLPPIDLAADLPRAVAEIIKLVGAGALTPDEAALLAGLLDGQRRAIETAELEKRLAAIENHIGKGN